MSLPEQYKKQIVPEMIKRFGYKSVMAVPRIEKVVINAGIGKFLQDEKIVHDIANDLALIAGQRPSFRQAKKAIAGFKTRKGLKVGLAVTLRGRRAFDFIERLINLALPRTRDFRGIEEKSVDQYGTLNLGIKEQIAFPEVSYENVKNIFGFQVTVKTTAKKYEEGMELLRLLGFPIKGFVQNFKPAGR